MSLRSASEIPFLGKQPVNEISGAKLPTKLLIFCHFFYHHKELSKNSTDAIHATAKSVVTCWEKAGCKTKKIDGIKNDIKQGRIHGSISRGRVGRSGKPQKVTLLQTDGPMDRPTDRPTDGVTYRVACTRLKNTARDMPNFSCMVSDS